MDGNRRGFIGTIVAAVGSLFAPRVQSENLLRGQAFPDVPTWERPPPPPAPPKAKYPVAVYYNGRLIAWSTKDCLSIDQVPQYTDDGQLIGNHFTVRFDGQM